MKNNSEITRTRNKPSGKHGWKAGKLLEVGVVACLLAGGFGVLIAVHMEQVSDALPCLLGSFGACGLVCYLYFDSGSSAS